MKIYTKDSLIAALKEIKNSGWVPNTRPGNDGGVGNTLEDLLGIKENNLPIPNAAEWELKAQRSTTSSLTTLFHSEPSPTAIRFVPNILLPLYGWAHQEAGNKYPPDEMSFRQTINAQSRSDRGFGVVVDREQQKICISFDHTQVNNKHREWLRNVEKRVGLGELNPQPYWGFQDLYHKIGSKLHNCFYAKADIKKINGKTHFNYRQIYMLRGISLENIVYTFEMGYLLVDFDARTRHNHGTKFRLRQNHLPDLYSEIVEI